MRIVKAVAVAAAAAILLLAVLTGSAAASRALRFSTGEISLLASALTITTAESRIVCEVIIGLTLTETRVAKRPANPIGNANPLVLGQEEGAERCSENWARFLPAVQELQYLSFTGTLPEITGLNLQISRFTINIRTLMTECLIEANVLGTQAVARGRLGALRLGTLEGVTIFGMCREPAVRGTLTLFEPRSVTVELVVR
ncbi:MAG: hypothetical protein WBC33_13105 [Conexibacter sp.]